MTSKIILFSSSNNPVAISARHQPTEPNQNPKASKSRKSPNPTNRYGLTAVPPPAQDLLKTAPTSNPNPRNPTSTTHQRLCVHALPKETYTQPLTTSVPLRARDQTLPIPVCGLGL
ncbi:hypothetical protein N7489_008653 [Penicillium chrysogenum]|uniref:uncharacterized protein n=1 Tax=Penicillium chrysogenum TaxID=5076 RepID=UPI0024DF2553|nr:uncharacterized protein N7489_008653 [Penicillium chrysogenum]KAJ5227945.1 hypothetical protein N7489_008653 [Penicillium chrysogenum]